jgi:N-hydroxyarylamine O-acetyltransferase
MAEGVDIDAYFRRIGYRGSRTPTLETLAAIHLHHPQAIAFENLDPLLKRPISLLREGLESKMLHAGRGGWCFEQNLLLRDVLEDLGFRVTGLAARVMWNAPQGTVRARSHMLLKIDGIGGGPYIADVGFGGLTLTAPLRLVPDIEQPTPHERFRLLRSASEGGIGDHYILEALVREVWKPLYNFDLQPQHLVDYQVSNWHLEHHPESPFVNNLMAARVEPERRYGLFNNKLSTHRLGRDTEQVTLATASEMRQVLEHVLRIHLPDDPGLDGLLASLSTRP